MRRRTSAGSPYTLPVPRAAAGVAVRWLRPAAALTTLACAPAVGGLVSTGAPPPLDLAGQRVLVLPVQAVQGLPAEQRERATAELYFALREHDAEVTWIGPADLEAALRRNPAYAVDPERLPADPLVHHDERRAVDPLASELRRYAALMDARLVLLPRELRAASPADTAAMLTLSAALLDARTGEVLWWGEGVGRGDSTAGSRTLAGAAASLADHLMGDRKLETTR